MAKLLTYSIALLLLLSCGSNEKSTPLKTNNTNEIVENKASLATKKEEDWWVKRHQTILNRLDPASELILIGNSIFHTLDSEDRQAVWEKHLNGYKTINMGISADRTENVIWRLQNGTLEHINPKVAVILIGTNNTDGNHFLEISTAPELANGIKKICTILQKKLPNTKILLMGILPYGSAPNHRNNIIKATNAIISTYPEKQPNVHYIDISNVYYNQEGMVNQALMPDYLHPNAEGHMLMFDALADNIKALMNK